MKLFISHASEDKADFVRPLAERLRSEFEVWYDEYELTVGDKLREKIDQGLRQCDYGVVVLSHHFFAKRWPQEELDGLFSLETIERKIILPVWKDITLEDVKKYSPILASRLAVSSDRGIEHVVHEIKKAVKTVPTSAPSEVESIVNLMNSSPGVGNKLQVVMGPGVYEPTFISNGRLRLTDSIRRRAKEIVKRFPDNYSNDPCAAVLYPPDWSDVPLAVHYHNLSYAEILALREEREYVGIISANVLLFSEEAKCILVHRRYDQSAHYPGALHTFGGAFIPPGSGPKEDHSGIRRAALREIFEESEAGIYISNQTPCILIDERHIQFIQTAFLGVNISLDQAASLKGNWEGKPIRIGFTELELKLLDMDEWTPSGWVHVLLWLALNTPGCNRPIKFGDDSGADISRSVMRRCL